MEVSDDVSVNETVTVVEGDSDSSGATDSVKELSAEILSAAMSN